jgi:hypothetical protein
VIQPKLNNRDQTMLVRGLHALVGLIESAKKATEKAFMPTGDFADELTYIVGAKDGPPGLLAKISSEADDLFADAHKTRGELAWEKIGRMPEEIIEGMADLGAWLIALPEGTDRARVLAQVTDAVERFGKQPMKTRDRERYAALRQGRDHSILANEVSESFALSNIIASALEQAVAYVPPEPVAAAAESAPSDAEGAEG